MKRHIIIGAGAAIILAGFYLGVVTLAESWPHALEQATDLWYWIAPLIIGFGIQAGLFSFIRQEMKRRRQAAGSMAVSGGVSAGSMVACCAHHLVDFLPALGLSGAALFLADYQAFFLAIGIASNLAGTAFMLSVIQRHGLSGRVSAWRLDLNPVKYGVILAVLPLLTLVFLFTT